VETREKILKQVITFLVITSVVSAGTFVWMFNGGGTSMAPVSLMMWSPGISAILTSLVYRDKIRNYGWKLGKARYLAYSYILPIVVALITYGLVWLSGIADFSAEEFGYNRWARMLGLQEPVSFGVAWLLRMSVGMLFTSIFTLGEEIGWSGFLTPKLSRIASVPVTSMIVGGYWAIWHYPAIMGGLYGTGAPLWVALPGFTLVLIGATLMRTVLVSESKSLWVGVILHSSHNMFLMGAFWTLTAHEGYANYFVSESGVFLGIIYILVAIIFWRTQMKSVPGLSAVGGY
jgi:membrane protease YdiL (CAAX protease family)